MNKMILYYKNNLDNFKKIKNHSHKHFIIFDLLKSFIKYKATIYDYLQFEFYSLNSKQRNTFLTTGKNNQIIKLFDNQNYFHILNNKNEFNNYFKKYLKRDFLNPNFTKDEFYNFISNKSNIIAKSIKNNEIITLDCQNKNIYKKYNNYLLEEKINQNRKLNELYDKTLNPIKILTFCEGNKTYILQAILEIGNNENEKKCKSIYTFLDDSGIAITPAVDEDDNIFGLHPISKKQILGFKVPLFEEAIKLALNAAKEIPQIKYICWDIAIGNDQIYLIKGYLPKAIQMKPRFTKDKIGILPKYEKIMKIKL